MALTVGTGPFGQHPGGTFNFERLRTKGVIWFEDSPRRIRARFGGETIVDSRHAKMLHEHAHLPIYYFPQEEVRMDLLLPSEKHTTCPYKGEASYWSVHAGGKVAQDAVWSYPEPLADAPPLAGYMAFYWNKMDEWLEEDEPAIVHARDPYHRIDVLDSSRHVRISLEGELLAESTRPTALFESNLPPRWYLPREDVLAELEPTDTVTRCGYKGKASYYAVRLGSGDTVRDLVWTYEDPLDETARIRDLLCFFNERVDIELDGEPQERPVSAWSRGVKEVTR
jgi:uncharacterized protein (DUF427 family)